MSSYNYIGEFKLKYCFETRREESKRVMAKYQDRVPVIVENEKDTLVPLLDKRKYLVPDDMTVGQFMYIVRKRLKLKPEIGLYLFFNQTLSTNMATMGSIYKTHKDPDGFLYAVIGAERTFG